VQPFSHKPGAGGSTALLRHIGLSHGNGPILSTHASCEWQPPESSGRMPLLPSDHRYPVRWALVATFQRSTLS